MKDSFKKNWSLLFICLVSLCIFFKLFTSRLLPVPGDLLVSFYFPWYSGGWEGYSSWTTHKEFLASDAIRQGIPWKFLAVESFKNGQWPLWNPYNFSGTPLLANLQSSIFYPLNCLFFLFPFLTAWVIYIMLQPLLASCFTYLYSREIGLSPQASALAALGFISSSFMLVWLEIGIVGHTILWLPLIFFSLEKIIKQKKLRFYLLLIFASVACVFSGHLQTSAHVFIFSSAYFLAKSWINAKDLKQVVRALLGLGVWGLFTFLLSSMQLLPALELNALSPLTEPFAKITFQTMKTPWINLITFFAPDVLGNPASLNFWSQIYGDGTPFFGVVPLFFALYSFFARKDFYLKFFSFSAFFYLLYAFPGPIYHLVKLSRISLFASTIPARSMFVVIFSLSLSSAIGLDTYLNNRQSKNYRRRFMKLVLLLTGIYLLFFSFSLSLGQIMKAGDSLRERALIARNNLILPFCTFLSLPFFHLILSRRKNFKNLFTLGVFIPSFLLLLYQVNKTLPFSQAEFFFPQHRLISYLQAETDINRFMGIDTAKFGTNLNAYYHLFSPRGYDSMRIKRYAELLAAQSIGTLPAEYPRSDADFIDTENGYRKRILDLLGVKYFLDKNDLETKEWNPEPARFPGDSVELAWQEGKFKVYRRTDALPRLFLTADYLVETDKKIIIEKLLSFDFPLKSTLILETEPDNAAQLQTDPDAAAEIITYTPNQVIIKTKSAAGNLLFLSDAYYPGWKAYINQQETKIYRADYAFRALVLPAGENTIEFRYEPLAFKIGIYLFYGSMLLLSGLLIYAAVIKKRVF